MPLGTTILEAAQEHRGPHPHPLLPPRPVRGRRLPHLRGRGGRAADAAGGVRLPDHGAHQDPDPHRGGAHRPAARPRPAALDALRRVLQLHSGTATASCRSWPRSTGSTASASATSARSRYRSTARATRSSATWTSASSAGAACAPASTCRRWACSRRSTAANKMEISTYLRQAAGRRGLHQLRAVHQPLPHRRPARQRRVRRGLARRSTTRRSTSSSRRRPARARPSASASASSRARR